RHMEFFAQSGRKIGSDRIAGDYYRPAAFINELPEDRPDKFVDLLYRFVTVRQMLLIVFVDYFQIRQFLTYGIDDRQRSHAAVKDADFNLRHSERPGLRFRTKHRRSAARRRLFPASA